MMQKSALTLLISLLFLSGISLIGKGVWIAAKAEVAQVLLLRAWGETLATGTPQKPWPWADMRPVAMLSINGMATQIVLEGTSGEALTFGPGLMAGLSRPGLPGVSVLAAHRDTHFSSLKQVEIGAQIRLTMVDGHTLYYEVTTTDIVDSRLTKIRNHNGPEELLLVTCYPFDNPDPNGPMRFVVTAKRTWT